MSNLLLEIGTEEIPAGYIQPALTAIASNLTQKLMEARIEHGGVQTFGTPRRLSIRVENVAAKQQATTSEIIGPPASVAYDAEGRATMAAVKFAEKVSVDVKRLAVKETPKGAYLFVTKTERGQAASKVLKEILPKIILDTPFPKTMRWADLDLSFARPIHHIVALLGKQVVSFKLGPLKSGRYTTGHFFMSPGKIKLDGADDYFDALRRAHVIVDIDERRQKVIQDIAGVAAQLGGHILPDDDLVDINTNLVENPIVVAGKFDDEFLEVPDEVLINAMREHQKYFSVVDENGKLMPHFISVNNTKARDMSLVARGHERVIRARLADAQFFYRGDLEVSNEQRVEKLKGVMFQAQLGTMYEKTRRVERIAEYIAESIADTGPGGSDPELIERVKRAALLCKSDLVSQVVVEFPKLQGVMGRVYAQLAGEPPDVAAAVEEHYRPVHSGAALPQTKTGAMLSLADKMDSIAGCFSVGLIPTGASDPYALRRQGIGMVQIILDKGFLFSLPELIETSLKLFDIPSENRLIELKDQIHQFIQNRMAHLLAEDGFSKDVIAAVISVPVGDVPTLWRRVEALETLKAQPDFEPLVAGFKRVGNILKKSGIQADTVQLDAVNPQLFENDSESVLYSAYREVSRLVTDAVDHDRYDQALVQIASLREPVDRFFDEVMVMTDKVEVRQNRLALLGYIANLFESFADFSKIST